MALPGRASHYVAAGLLTAGGLLWATHEAWPWRRPLTAAPIVVTDAYAEVTATLGRRETLAAVLARAGITGRDYAGFLAAAQHLPVRRLRPGLAFQVRRLKTDSQPERVTVRLSPERRLQVTRADAGWIETVETIPWTIVRLRVTGAIESSLYDALDRAVADTFLPGGERRALAWAIADVYDWEVDFTRDVRSGDRFIVLLERLESPEGERRFGRILGRGWTWCGPRATRSTLRTARRGSRAFTTNRGGRCAAPSCARRWRSAASRAGSAAASIRSSTSGAPTRAWTSRRPTARRCAPPRTAWSHGWGGRRAATAT